MTLHHSREQIPGVDQDSAQAHPVLKAERDRMDVSKPWQVDEVPENGKGILICRYCNKGFFYVVLWVVE